MQKRIKHVGQLGGLGRRCQLISEQADFRHTVLWPLLADANVDERGIFDLVSYSEEVAMKQAVNMQGWVQVLIEAEKLDNAQVQILNVMVAKTQHDTC